MRLFTSLLINVALVIRSFNRPLLYLFFWFTLQSFVKHFLTEGDKIILNYVSSAEDQGVFSVVTNYGKNKKSYFFL